MRVIPFALAGLVVLTLTAPGRARAATTAICDANGTSASLDGTIGASEYASFSTGINAGFGGMIGAGVRLYADGDRTGASFALDATGHACTWGSDDSVVVYIDSTSGGFSSTAGFTDAADGGRAAASGLGTGGGASVLTFATSFFADYAIVLRNDSASLFQLTAGGSHVFVRSLTRAPSDWTTNPCVREVGGVTFADIASTGSFHYVATLINASNAFRSDELQGSAALAFAGGAIPMTLPADGFNVFSRVSSVQTLTPAGAFEEHFCTFGGAGAVPTPLATQLDSDLWRVNGFSDGAMSFGGTFTTGDFARLVGTDATTTGGLYAFRQTPAERGLGIQPGGSDVDPGDVDLRLFNNQTVATTSVTIRYNVYTLNNQTRSSTISFTYSTDGATFVSAGVADVVTAAAPDVAGWTLASRSVTLPLAVPATGALFLRWHHASSGANNRDKFAIDDVVVSPVFPPVCGNSVIESGETCDAGASNGTTTCGCTNACAFPVSGTVCGAAGLGTCDLDDTCNGTGACIVNVRPTGFACRPSTGFCDPAETCDGSAPSCPADGFRASGTVCAPASGACDLDDTCNATGACVVNVQPSSFVCRGAVDACDVAETCDGASTACPPNGFAPIDTVCAPASGVCDVDDTCNGSGVCIVTVMGGGVTCHPSTGPCDPEELCDGSSPSCAPDLLFVSGTVCNPASGAICDVSDTCDGVTASCAARFAMAGTTCASASPPCDLGASCTGASATCPANTPAPSTTLCRASLAGGCDVAEFCSGSSLTCGADVVAGAGVVCRPDSGLGCDVAESCTGTSNACPVDDFAGAGTPCRGTRGPCDVAESCTGLSGACPSDAFASGGECRASAGVCDPAESCDGSGVGCPVDVHVADGTSCDNGVACDGLATCQGGACATGTPPSCGDTNRCTTDACNEPSGACSHTPIGGCCNSDMECDDANLCTADSCGSSASCGHVLTAAPSCCSIPSECDDGDFCTANTCPTAGGACAFPAISSCCHDATECNDGVVCTTDTCDATTHTCQHASMTGCCTTAAQCNDSDVCTTDSCASDGSCGNVAVAGCCRADGDCVDTNTCTTDTCDTTTHTCTHGAIANCCHAGDGCDDSDFCTDDSCNTTTERCLHAAHSCDDTDACTSDSCSAGACQHAPLCVDGGVDAAVDVDAGVDGGLDAATDVDAGVDAAIDVDASSAGDSGSAHDAGNRDAGHDAGNRDGSATADAAPDAGAPLVTTGACGCRVGAAPRSPIALFGLGLLMAVLATRRRRGR